MLAKTILAATSAIAIAYSLPASAAETTDTAPVSSEAAPETEPTADETSPSDGDIVVTGSRLQLNGFQQPTPVTVLGGSDIKKSMPTNVSDYLNQIPSFGTPISNGNPGPGGSGGGLSLVNLRNLGQNRTLVLLDNRRVVISDLSGGVDTTTLPTTLIKQIDVVTGGASAAWGANAVAGVVNFVLDDKYEGVEIAGQSGITEQGDLRTYKFDLTAGTAFAGGRGHIVVAGTYSTSPDIVRAGERDWWNAVAVINNPAPGAGQPLRVTRSGVGVANQTAGGVVLSGPLRNMQFVDSGRLVPYNPGFVSANVSLGGDTFLLNSYNRNLSNKQDYGTLFGHLSYDVSDGLEVYAEASYGKSVTSNDSVYYTRQNLSIALDNAYLDPTVRQTLVNGGATSLVMNKLFGGYAGLPQDGNFGSRNQREVFRSVVGAKGQIGDDWSWGAYYQRGRVEVLTESRNNPLVPRLNLAIDAVRDGTGNIVCRSTLTNPGNGCVPFNVFGPDSASQAALDYVYGTKPFQLINFKQDFVSAEVQGKPFTLPAGDVAIVLGADASWERAVGTQDDQSRLRNYFSGNFQPFTGEISYKEAFGEIVVPLIHDTPLLQKLELNGAVRFTDYSTSGSVTTWKIGLSNEITDDLRVRVTRSRDIRAPSLAELFTQGQNNTQNVIDPFTNATYVFLATTQGNRSLQPEFADTFTAGIVYRPSWAPGLGLSVDYYDIKIDDAIATLTAQQTVDQCFGGLTALCGNIIRNSSNAITQVISSPQNVAQLGTRGIDLELSYRRPAGQGNLSLRALGSYVDRLYQISSAGVRYDYAGELGTDFTGPPQFKGLLTSTYDQGPLSLTGQLRFIGAGKVRNDWVEGVDVDKNRIASAAYVDLRGSYTIDAGATSFKFEFAIDNLLDSDPRIVPSAPGFTFYAITSPHTRADLYDVYGRRYRVGVRVNF